MMKSKLYILAYILVCCLVGCEQNSIQFRLPEQKFEPITPKELSDTLLPPVRTAIMDNALQRIEGVTKTSVPLRAPYGVGAPATTYYGVADGLASNTVAHLMADRKGQIWIGGVGNLSIYNGSSFVNYNSENGAGSLFINTLLEDFQGQVWIQSFKAIRVFDGQGFELIQLGNEALSFYGMVLDRHDAIWIASNQGVFKVQNDSISRFGLNDGLEDELIYRVLLDQKGQVLALCESGIFRFEGGRFNRFNLELYELMNSQWASFMDSKGNLWCSTSIDDVENVGYIKNDEFQIVIKNEPLFTRGILEDSAGKIWIPQKDYLYIYDGENTIRYSHEELGTDQIYSLEEDKEGNIWAGTASGLFKLFSTSMSLLELPVQDSKYFPLFTMDSHGVKWMAPSDYQLIRYGENDVTIYDLSQYLEAEKGTINSVNADYIGNIWLGTGGPQEYPREMIKFDGTDFFSYSSPQGFDLSYVNSINQISEDELVFSGNGGILKFDGKTSTKYGSDQGYPARATFYLFDSNARSWVGTSDSGAYVFHNESVINLNTENGLPHNYVNTMAEWPQGTIWLGTDGGLSRYKNGKLSNYSKVDGLSNLVSAICIDTIHQQIWLNTIEGLASMDFEQVDADKPVFRIFSQANGFEHITGNFVRSSIYYDSSGVWVEGFNDVYKLDVDQVKNYTNPPLEISNIRIDNAEVIWSFFLDQETQDSTIYINESALKLDKKLNQSIIDEQFKNFGGISISGLEQDKLIPKDLTLPYVNNNITFEFGAISPSFGKHTDFRYKLEGYDRNWSPYSKQKEAFFGNMNEGNYTFHIEAKSAFGEPSSLSYSFRVLPPWYRTWWAYILYSILLLVLVWRVHILQKSRTLRKERERLQSIELEQAKEIEKAYSKLKSTQAQLVHSEKMASLGELTAGIAHEIQNPLNFVNNFSEVSQELIDEMAEEIDKGDLDEVKELSADIKGNLEKITHHGKRADAIVKGMLAHSRSGKGEKAQTDINALAEEYLKLSYHGLRAKDKTFNAEYAMELHPELPRVNVVPQDIGRVLLNLFNNAFQACTQSRTLSARLPDGQGVEMTESNHPLVTLTTKRTSEGIEISVKDNGPGIPQDIRDKIFQPFFTTKPTGQGTGLGLSLSYDIIKAHGGEITCKSGEGTGLPFSKAGTEFIIKLPN